jgi:tripartite-type tricarboxylate transporter receptor subunit TctC
MRSGNRTVVGVLAACGLVALSGAGAPAARAAYPDRPIRFIVPQAPGSASDTSARILAFELTRQFGQQVVVDNRPGGALTIGIDLVAKAPPDGYTIGYGNIGGLSINRAILPKVPYDALKDLTPVAQTNTGNMLLAVSVSLPVKTVKELVDHARQHPGKLSNASSGNGTPGHLGGEYFKLLSDTRIVHVPYKGGQQAITDMISGQVHVMFESMSSITPHHRAGRVRGIAVTGPRRTPGFPELPTVAESGVPGYDVTVWSGIIAPAGLPKPLLARLNAEANRVVESPTLREKYAVNGAEPLGGTPEAFRDLIRNEIAKWADVAKRSGARID